MNLDSFLDSIGITVIEVNHLINDQLVQTILQNVIDWAP